MAKAKATTKKTNVPRRASQGPAEAGISAIAVEGFKSIRTRTEISIKPLTILAGANSSGKSSIMQPLLLMKQTLEAPYDPGALLLDGPHVHFTAVDQMISRSNVKAAANYLWFSVEIADGGMVAIQLLRRARHGLDVVAMTAARPNRPRTTIHLGMSGKELSRALSNSGVVSPDMLARAEDAERVIISRERCFLRSAIKANAFLGYVSSGSPVPTEATMEIGPLHLTDSHVRTLLHVPALRGNPERTYKTTAVGDEFSGPFDPYVASIIHHWQTTRDIRLKQLGAALQKLGLNWKVEAARLDDTRVELRVGRLKQKRTGGVRDLVSIADVGFGVSQCLPVLVALLTARPGQLVYIEEPEIHLHPRAQVALAEILADAANRGVRVVIETHSSLLLTGVQALVAEGALPPERVALHWFSLDKDGATEVRSADLDEAGAFGDWPEDFAEVALEAQARYLDAAEKRLRKAKR